MEIFKKYLFISKQIKQNKTNFILKSILFSDHNKIMSTSSTKTIHIFNIDS